MHGPRTILEPAWLAIRRGAAGAARIDGRFGVAATLALYFGGLWIANAFVPYTRAWKALGIPTVTPPFADLRGVLAGFECTRLGYDVLRTMPCDPYGEGLLPYPRLWMTLRWTGLDMGDTVWLAVVVVASWYAAVFVIAGRLNRLEAIVYGLLLCSPASMLLVERANVDLLVFDLLFVASLVVASRRPTVRAAGYALILVTALLKILPIFAAGVVLKEKRRRNAAVALAVLAIGFVAYAVVIRDELALFHDRFVLSEWYANGARLLPRLIRLRADELRTEGLRVHGVSNVAVLGLAAAFVVVAARVVVAQARRLASWLCSSDAPSDAPLVDRRAAWRLDAFRIGSGVFVGSFVVTVTFDYKLTVLLFTVPQLFDWIRHDDRLGRPAALTLVGLVAMFYAGPLLYRWTVDEMINWTVAALLVHAFASTLPAWAKTSLRALVPSGLRRPATGDQASTAEA